MSMRQLDGFFYGLFMDVNVLREAGTNPTNVRHAYVDDFALRIGKRATLIPSSGNRAYGMLIALSHRALDILYSAPGLEVYCPEALIAQPFEGEAVPALCYNLTNPPKPHERNPEYAEKLQRVLRELGFPEEYVNGIG